MSLKIITDLRTLNSIAKKFGLIVNKQHKYITYDNHMVNKQFEHNGKVYEMRFYSGCFFAYIAEVVDDKGPL